MKIIPVAMGGSRVPTVARRGDACAPHAEDNADRHAERVGPVAVVHASGPLIFRPGFFDLLFDGAVSSEHLALAIQAAADDESIDRILLDVDSPGGTVAGIDDLVKAVAYARERKPIVAVAHECCCSAAYFMVAGCDRVVATPTAEVGSVGVGVLHVDETGYHEKIGIRVEAFGTGAQKLAGMMGTALSDDQRTALQARLDAAYGRLRAHVARHRGMADADIDALEAGHFYADEAAARGLVDEVVGYEEFLRRYVAADTTNRATAMATRNDRRSTMAETTAPVATSLDELKDQDPEGYAQLMKDAKEQAKAEMEEEEKAENGEEEEDEATARKGTPATFAQLDELTPAALDNRDAFIAGCQRKGYSVARATAAVQSEMLEQMKALKAKLGEKQEIDDGTSAHAGGSDPVSAGGGGGGKAGGEFLAEVARLMKDENLSRAQATARVAREKPELQMRLVGEARAKALAG